ncbi:MAG: ATP-dependent helicase [Nitrospirae bacterium]|nr:ATP-dependent helicase [Nitrospirota bacterium]
MLNLPYTPLERLLSDLTLERVSGDEDIEAGGVVLSTIHQAKGLEWNTVFIIGLNDGRFPSRKSLVQEGLEEERRLFYVACTRAKKLLILCYTLTDNGYSMLEPSRFLTELPEDVYEEVEIEYGI